MAAIYFYLPFRPAIGLNSMVVPGAKLYLYYSGTSTLAPVYSDSGLSIALPNPVIANAAGTWPSIYIDDAIVYRVILEDQDGVTLDEIDPYYGGVVGETGAKGDPGGNAMAVGLATAISGLSIAAGTDLIHTTGYTTAGSGAALYIADTTADAALAAAHPRFCKATSNGRYFRLLPDARGTVFVDAGGATGNGTTDDLAAIDAARNYAVAIGAGRIGFTKGRTYRTSALIASGNNLAWDFNGATLKCSGSVEVFGSAPTGSPLAYVSADITGPTSTLTVTTTSGLSVGQFVLVRLGHNPWDNVEPMWGQAVKIAAIGSGTITIDATVPRAIPLNYASTYTLANGTTVAVPSVGSTGPNRAIYALTDGDNVEVNDLVFVGDTASNASVEGVLWFQGGRNLRFNNIRANLDTQGTGDAGTGLFGILQFCRNVVINDPVLLGNKNGRAQASLGRMFNLSNCINVSIKNPVARDLQNTMIFAESFCEDVVIDKPTLEFTATAGSGVAAFFVAQGSQVTVRDPYIIAPRALTWYMHDDGGADGAFNATGHIRLRGQFPASIYINGGMLVDYDGAACSPTTVTISGTTMTLASGQTGLHAGVEVLGNGISAGTKITAETGGGVYTVNNSQTVAAGTSASFREYATVDFRASRTVAIKMPLSDAGTEYSLEGPFWNFTAFASSDADVANIDVYPLRNGVACALGEISGSMQAGKGVRFASSNLHHTSEPPVMTLTGKSSILHYRTAGTAPAGAFLGFTALVGTVIKSSYAGAALPLASGSAATYSDSSLENLLTGKRVLRGSATYDAPSIASGAQTTTGVTVAGAAVGDRVRVSLGIDISGLIVTGYVNSVSSVIVVLANLSGGAIDLGSTTIMVEVEKP